MIGIYDSGIGGLGIYNEIRSVFPHENISYFGDTMYFPFGGRSQEEIRSITLTGLKHLEPTCSIIVLACNSASVNDLEYFRSQISVPIIGVVPVIKTAAQLTKNGKIALLATPYTVSAPYTLKLIEQYASDKHVTPIGCAGLADDIEHGTIHDHHELIDSYINAMGDADVVVLGCTHYTLIKGLIQYKVGPDVRVIDSNEAVARQVLRVMKKENLEDPQEEPEQSFACSGDHAAFQKQVRLYVV